MGEYQLCAGVIQARDQISRTAIVPPPQKRWKLINNTAQSEFTYLALDHRKQW